MLSTRPVGKSYKLVPHDGFSSASREAAASDLPTGNVTVTDRLYDGGLRAHRTIHFNDLTCENIEHLLDRVRLPHGHFQLGGHVVGFQIFSVLIVTCAGILWCSAVRRHITRNASTPKICPGGLDQQGDHGAGILAKQPGPDGTMAGPSCRNASLLHAGNYDLQEKRRGRNRKLVGDGLNRRLMNYLLHRFRGRTAGTGPHQWAGYNALTHWSTHLPMPNGPTTTGRHGRRAGKIRFARSSRGRVPTTSGR